MDLGKPLGQEGRQSVGIAVPHQQQLAAVRHSLVFNDAQGLVPAQKRGILVLLFQVHPVIQAGGFLLPRSPGGNGQTLLRHPEFHGIRLQPVDAGLGIERSVKAVRGSFWCKVISL